jgi:hypothetical protein
MDNQARKAVTKVSILILHPMIFYRAHGMRQRNVLDGNEWPGWFTSYRNYFLKGTINEIWQQIEPDNWFNSVFQNFNKGEIINDFPRS